MAIHNSGEKQELAEAQDRLDAAKKSSKERGEKVDDLTSRFREIRRRNHFRLMLEDIFNE